MSALIDLYAAESEARQKRRLPLDALALLRSVLRWEMRRVAPSGGVLEVEPGDESHERWVGLAAVYAWTEVVSDRLRAEESRRAMAELESQNLPNERSTT